VAPPNPTARPPGDTTGDMFLKVTGVKFGLIKGESQDDDHKDEIEVLSWSWGMHVTPSLGGGGATGKATIHELKILKRVDRASTALMQALRSNESIKEAKLTLRKAGKTQLEYLKITIGDGRVISLEVEAGDESGSSELLERVSFSFNQIDVEYVPQGKDGLPQGGTLFSDEFSG
jgi:type VI secretion system secreted protein Hcp